MKIRVERRTWDGASELWTWMRAFGTMPTKEKERQIRIEIPYGTPLSVKDARAFADALQEAVQFAEEYEEK